MTTTFEGTPAVDEVLAGANLVATGFLKDVIDREEDEEDRVLLIYRVEVTDVLSGELEDREITVRMVGDGETKVSDEEHLLVLSPDFGRGTVSQYVPYFTQPNPIREGRCSVEDGKTIGIDEIRERLAKIEGRQERRAASLAEEEQGQDLEAEYPEVTEVGTGRGETVFEAQLAEPRDSEERSHKQSATKD